MKIQHLAVIFVLIIMPISIVLSAYTSNQIDAINMQTAYDSNLVNATYDAVKAFQLNTTNNMYSSISNSKIRDIEASVNTFYNSLNTSMSDYSYAASDLEAYTPAMLFTLYDGYYIYTSYDNVYSTEGEDEDEKVKITLDGHNYQNGLKPYVYYSAKYKLPHSNNVIVVNYTLDNAITVYGDFGEGYVTRSGYLINPDYVTNVNDTAKTLQYGKPGNQITIEPEELEEHLTIMVGRETGGTGTDSGDYNYIFYQNDKIYQDKDGSYFWYRDYIKTPVNDPNIIADLNATKQYSDDGNTIMSTSAYDYYASAKEFSEWVKDKLGNIKMENTLRVEDGVTPVGADNLDYVNQTTGERVEYLSENTGNENIFDVGSDNDPMLSGSTFNNHRLAIIRKTIETSLNTVISNYHTTGTYEYAMPVISDDDWYRITNNVSMVTFMQGMTIGFRYYNNYAVITNNINKEVVKPENIYIITEPTSGDRSNREYHQPGCRELLQGLADGDIQIVGTYPTASFQRQSVRLTEDSEGDVHYYLQARGTQTGGGAMQNLVTIAGCYNCIVSATSNYDTNDIIAGDSLVNFQDSEENDGSGAVAFANTSDAYRKVRTAYLTALARERYDLYKSNFDLEL